MVSGKCLDFIFPQRKLDGQGREIIPPAAMLREEAILQDKLFDICTRCKAVICCRVSPIQKSQVRAWSKCFEVYFEASALRTSRRQSWFLPSLGCVKEESRVSMSQYLECLWLAVLDLCSFCYLASASATVYPSPHLEK